MSFDRPGEGPFLLVKGTAGLGNRLLALLTGLLYARIANRRLVVDWSDDAYADAGENAFHQLFVSAACGTLDELPGTDSVAPALWRGRLRESLRELWATTRPGTPLHLGGRRCTSIVPARLEHPEAVIVFWSYFQHVGDLRRRFTGQFAPLRALTEEQVLRRTFLEHLAPHPEVDRRVREFREQHFQGPLLGVHVRYTDKRSRLDAILERTAALMRREPGRCIFLATDSAEVRRIFRERYPRLVSTELPLGAAGRPLHRDASRRRLEGGRDALVDFFLLASCDRLVIDSCSSFAHLAAVISPAAPDHVVDVHPLHLIPRGHRARVFRAYSRFLYPAVRRLQRLLPGRGRGAPSSVA